MPEPQVIVEQTVPRFDEATRATQPFYRVYVWAERPDAGLHLITDQMHWKFDSEHRSLELANKRRDDLLTGRAAPWRRPLESRSQHLGSPEIGSPTLTLHLGGKKDEQNGR